MNKKYIVIFVIIILVLVACACMGFFYHDEIEKILEGDNWNYVNSYAEINSVQPLACFGRKNLCVCTKEGFRIYNNNSLITKKEITISDFMYDSNGIFSVIYISDTKSFYLIKNGEIILTKSLDISPKSICVNKSGNVVILYSQLGYKTGIKVYKSDGVEILTTYLANSYATCAKISSDDKFLYVGEVDSSGIKIRSKVKIINLSNKEANDIELPLGGIIVDINNYNNKIIAKTDIGVYEIDNNTKDLKTVSSYNEKSVINAYINGSNGVVLLDENQESYSNGYEIVFLGFEPKLSVEFNEYPQDIDIYEDVIALNFGSEVWIIKNGHLKDKIAITEALSGMNIFSEGKEIALMFRNSIKIVKI